MRKRTEEKSQRGNDNMNRILLMERTERLSEGYAGDEEYNHAAIKCFANIPFGECMAGYEEFPANMYHLLGITKEEAEHMTYQEVAKRIDVLYRSQATRTQAVSIMKCLMKPFDHCYEERKQYYEEV